eukprot:CAMPEP_0184500054 /NCGR_PEP_ID=MMETSP0113_2-20130426/43463_1 /TAXON_ID=91329 /ORGANISM="Norrisiella sphaerica, Strain BC52" /LENGTH=149 /DNA_ID=CAMNT_0026888253 /DNA_START=251 /DNA_END=700 /DNA_ORIENTATION=-
MNHLLISSRNKVLRKKWRRLHAQCRDGERALHLNLLPNLKIKAPQLRLCELAAARACMEPLSMLVAQEDARDIHESRLDHFVRESLMECFGQTEAKLFFFFSFFSSIVSFACGQLAFRWCSDPPGLCPTVAGHHDLEGAAPSDVPKRLT